MAMAGAGLQMRHVASTERVVVAAVARAPGHLRDTHLIPAPRGLKSSIVASRFLMYFFLYIMYSKSGEREGGRRERRGEREREGERESSTPARSRYQTEAVIF